MLIVCTRIRCRRTFQAGNEILQICRKQNYNKSITHRAPDRPPPRWGSKAGKTRSLPSSFLKRLSHSLFSSSRRRSFSFAASVYINKTYVKCCNFYESIITLASLRSAAVMNIKAFFVAFPSPLSILSNNASSSS